MVHRRKLLKIIFFTFWINVLILYLLSFSITMPVMPMGEMHLQMAHHVGGTGSILPCCEIFGTACASTIGYTSEIANVLDEVGKIQIAPATIITQLIFLDIHSPPPKA